MLMLIVGAMLVTSAGSVGLTVVVQARNVSAEAMLDASVTVKTVSHVVVDQFGDSVWSEGTGSGFLVSSARCEVWTNYHVVEDAALIEVVSQAGDTSAGIEASMVSFSPRLDLAVLRMERCDGIAEARFGNSDNVRAGDEVYAVGNPLGRNPDSISRGIISHTRRYNGTTPYLQTDASINQGNSGGALFNRRGEVIGINTALARARDSGNTGIGYAVPVNIIREIASELEGGSPGWGDAGLTELVSNLDPRAAAQFGVSGGRAAILLTDTPVEGPAVGMLFKNDAVFGIGGADVESVDQSRRLLAGYRPGEQVRFDVMRAGKHEKVSIKLGDGWKEPEASVADAWEGYLGLTLEVWGDDDGEEEKFETPVITQVQSLGPAHRARIASSQHSAKVKGPFVVPFVLDVKTVTGVFRNGEYYPVENIATVDALASEAWRENAPLLLEIEHWTRSRPGDLREPLQHTGTLLHLVEPAQSRAATTAVIAAVSESQSDFDFGDRVAWHFDR